MKSSASIPRPPPTNPAPVWHAQSTDAALAALAATAQGLTQAEAEQRLATHGPNSLPTPPAPSALMRLLRQLAAEGLGVVVVLHDINLAGAYADQVLVMNDGRIETSGDCEEVLQPQLVQRIWGVVCQRLTVPDAHRSWLAFS